MPRSRIAASVAGLALLSACNAEPGRGDRSDLVFANCLAHGSRCIAEGLSVASPAPAPSGDPELMALTRAATDYLAEADAQRARPHWVALLNGLEAFQRTPADGRAADSSPSARSAMLLLPAGSDFPAGCENWIGAYRDGGRNLATAREADGFRFHLDLRCTHGGGCGGTAAPYRATVEISAPPPDGRTGTGSWYRYTDVPVRTAGELLIAYAESDLYPDAARAVGPAEYCGNRPAPCYAKSAGRGEVLFAALMNCSAGQGLLQWGALSDEAE